MKHGTNANDLHVGYDLKTEWLGDDRIGPTAVDIADTNLPFHLGATGYDNWVASPPGHVIKLSLTARL